jgi:chorismate mutase
MIAVTFPEAEERLVNDQRELDELYQTLAEIDEEILRAVRRRSHLTRMIASDGAHSHLSRNGKERFGELGTDGHVLGRLLHRLAHSHS